MRAQILSPANIISTLNTPATMPRARTLATQMTISRTLRQPPIMSVGGPNADVRFAPKQQLALQGKPLRTLQSRLSFVVTGNLVDLFRRHVPSNVAHLLTDVIAACPRCRPPNSRPDRSSAALSNSSGASANRSKRKAKASLWLPIDSHSDARIEQE